MDSNWLDEYMFRQSEAANKRARSLADEFASKGASLPRLVDWEFKSPYSNRIHGVPILAQVPFFEQQILVLDAFRTEKDFRENYGLSVSQLIDLWKAKKKVLVGLSNPSSYVGLDYLDPILEKEPPCLALLVTELVSRMADVQGGSEYYSACFDVAYQKISSVNQQLLRHLSNVLLTHAVTPEDIASLFAQDYAILCAYGMEDLASRFLVKSDIESLLALKKYANYLVLYPRYYAFDGIVSLWASEVEQAKRLGFTLNSEVFPVDVATLIVRKLPIVFVKDIGFEQAIELHGRTAELRRLLSEMDRYAAEGELSGLPRSEAIEKAFEEAKEGATEIAKSGKLYTIFGEAGLGILGAAAGTALAGTSGFVAGAILGMVGPLPFIDRLAERLAKWKRKSHAIAYFDLGLSFRRNRD